MPSSISSDVSMDLETALVRGGNIDSYQISKIIDEIEKNLVKQVAFNPRQLLLPFHKLCLKLLDRLFGEDTTTGIGVNLPLPWIKGPQGGWLRRLIYIPESRDRYVNDSKQTSSSSSSSIFYHQLRVVECFSPKSNLLDLMFTKNRSGSVGTNYEMKLAFFPQKLRMLLNNDPLYPCVKSDNREICFTLFQISLQDQIQHIHAKIKDSTLLLEPIEYFLICLIRYPLSGGPPVLTPLTFNHSSSGYDNKLPTVVGVENWIRPFPYLRLLNEYLKEFIPLGSKMIEDSKYGSSGYSNHNNNMMPMVNEISQVKYLFLVLVAEFWFDSTLVVRQNHRLTQQSQRGTSISISQTPGNSASYHPQATDVIVLEGGFSIRSMASMQCAYLLLLHILSDKTLLDQYKVCLNNSWEDIKKLSHNVGGLGGNINNIHETFHDFSATMKHRNSREMNRNPLPDIKSTKVSYLPLYIKFLQQPVYDMLRAMISRNDSNASDEAMFHMAIRIWLLYINPWKAPSAYTNGYYNSSGKYISTEWRCYVAANLHFYTTLVVILFRSISRIDISIQIPEDRSKLIMLEKIMEGLTQDDLWSDVELLSSSFQRMYPKLSNPSFMDINSKDSNLFRMEMDKTSSNNGSRDPGKEIISPAEFHLMRYQHHYLYPDRGIDNLEDYGIVNVITYSNDAGRLLVDSLALVIFRLEIRKQRPIQGNILWRICVVIHGFIIYLFSTSNQTEFPEAISDDVCRRCRQLMKQLSAILDIDVTHALNPIGSGYLDMNGNSRRHGSRDDYVRDRITKKLTPQGKMKVLSGELHINQIDMDWLCIDPLDRPLATYEIHPWTKFLVKVSKDLNVLFNLPKDKKMNYITWEMLLRDLFTTDWRHALSFFEKSVRINLRFLSNLWYIMTFTMIFVLYLIIQEILSPWWLLPVFGFAISSLLLYT